MNEDKLSGIVFFLFYVQIVCKAISYCAQMLDTGAPFSSFSYDASIDVSRREK